MSLASYHGVPALCPTPEKAEYACCIHGMPTFPHWHRLYTLAVEHALNDHGSAIAIPYWDWTLPQEHLPEIFTEQTYYDAWKDEVPKLWKTSKDGEHSVLFDEVLLALEQEDYCDFEVQFELYSLSSLHYSAYDPIFFVHHSFVDKIWAVWQELQRRRHKPADRADCAVNFMAQPMHPFDSVDLDPDANIRAHAVPNTVFNYFDLGYKYDNLDIGGKNLDEIEELIHEHQAHDRVFAAFHLEGIGTSADVEFSVCEKHDESHRRRRRSTSDDCHRAGAFFILGGTKEMPWSFDRLYKYDITDALHEAHIEPEDLFDAHAPFYLEYEIHAVNGSALPKSVISRPTLVFEKGHVPDNRVRRDLSHLSEHDIASLKTALTVIQHDHGKGGWQAIGSTHGVPALCPTPEAAEFACCVHGMPTFPHWHRLYTLEVDRALIHHGSDVAIPYWDWTLPIDHLPDVVTKRTYHDLKRDKDLPNPFARSYVEEAHAYTERDPQPELKKFSADGQHSVLFDEVLLALEQDDYCNFEVQFEVTHNAIHYLVGGHHEHSMSSLHYSSYDPIFFLHHSFVDKLWAVWQELQKRRHKPYNTADCAAKYMDEPMHPFDDPELDPDDFVRSHAVAHDAFDYHSLGYQYDNLDVGGKHIEEIEELIREHQSHPRVFAGFHLEGIGTSADVTFYVCKGEHDENDDCHRAGAFFILGGSKEMPWSFDRLYKYDITDVLHDMHIEPEDAIADHAPFHFDWVIHNVNGSTMPASTISAPRIMYAPSANKIRHNLNDLSSSDLVSLEWALDKVQHDQGALGYQALAAYHGVPALCPTPEAAEFACCVHGMPTFPHWHRLYTLEVEHALLAQGSHVAIPYWDWTLAMDHLPEVLTRSTYFNEEHGRQEPNPFSHGYIAEAQEDTVRDPQPQLWKKSKDGEHSVLFDEVLLALEQEDYCDFEIQFEVTHNAIHYLVGGHNEHSLASLHYSAYDPAFFLHHSFVDKIWAVWQKLQKRRHKPYNKADCAAKYMSEPMHPFDDPHLDPDEEVRAHAVPETVFNYKQLGYKYDNYDIGGKHLDELEELIHEHQSHARVFAGFHLEGIGTSADVEFFVCKDEQQHRRRRSDENCQRAGAFFILGGSKEMPWSFDRLYKYDITDALHELHIEPSDVTDVNHPPFHINYEIHGLNGSALPKSLISEPTVIVDAAHVPENRVRHDLTHLADRDLVSLRSALHDLQQDRGKRGMQALASQHGVPALCPTPEAAEFACCVHGMPTFPHWHRLYTLEVERSLISHGSKLSMPYWDWTLPIGHLPALVTEKSYYDSGRHEKLDNPFARSFIDESHVFTVRDPQPELLKVTNDGQHSVLFDEVLLALEQDDYCDFEIQFEMTHNAIHYLVGGHNEYSMSTLHYSSYDPIFFLHHSFVDKVWTVWQELQKKRHKPYNTADCAAKYMEEPLHPFDDPDLDPDDLVRTHAVPSHAFDIHELGYSYDNLDIGGKHLDELEELIHEHQSHARVFAGFHLEGIGTSAEVTFYVCHEDAQHHDECARAGSFFILGGAKEMPWSFDRVYKYDVTDALRQIHVEPEEAQKAHPDFPL
nr:hypothetical protein BaRGS_019726 [Batillaria attramentaria]